MSANLRGPLSAVLAVAVAAGLWGCTCGSPPVLTEPCRGVAGAQPDRTATCSAAAECADHHACRAVEALGDVRCCLFENRACATEADCCPGQTCPATRLRCLDQSDSCAVDADCGALQDRFCETYTDAYGTSRRCRLRACGEHGACPEGQSCFQGECLAELPCDGHCEPGTACVPTLGHCQEYAAPSGREAAGCPLSCAPGFIATFTDGRNLWDACSLPDVACRCAELPALRSFDLGRFSALAAEPGRGLHVSEYDGQFGDLVVASYDLDGALLGARWVDGLPRDAGVIYGPSGPRGGVEAPGPDVGRSSDLVASGGRLYVSYYDVTHGDLKVAVRGPDGAWATHVVDGTGADVGLYSSIAVDSGGRPAVAYFQRGAEDDDALEACPAPRPASPPRLVTALKLARARTTTPSGPGDWVVTSLACLDTPPPPCDGCAGTCADLGSGPACLPAATGCVGCGGRQSCVLAGGAPTCATRATPGQRRDVPLGVGVFASLAFRHDEALVAAMRRAVSDGGVPKGELVGWSVSVGSAPSSGVVLDAAGDTGYFPDLKVDANSGRVAVGYHDASSRAFKLYLASSLRAGVPSELVDSGKDASGTDAFVGADSALVFLPDGGLVAVYQDATRGDLKLARRSSTWTVEAPMTSAGAVGFFADAVFTDGALYVSHARLRARTVKTTLRLESSLLLERRAP